jgi:regulator of ribonuclease activity A
VVDGGGSMRKALLGDMLAKAAVDNGWQGLVINGCVRDVEVIAHMELGVKALGTIPLKTDKRGEGQQGLSISFGNVTIQKGDFVYADENGVIVSKQALYLD